jgi:3-hydroxyacyl-CoA dehydrogenase/enoyl-CoA hydratase/3-hydroxybutyryl-CoA epimerase/3-hydroxyacyl-CoA dehydrogenase/enoyl-CoA hydratase/3-hydroxybutyryl-CoA epimerase/enoyl-CoA isomerase
VILEAYPDRGVPTPILGDLVKAGRLGKKSGAGFRKFTGKQGKPAADPEFDAFLEPYRTGDKVPSDEEIGDRMFLAMLLETTRVVEEGIVREPGDADMGLILGIGFPPFRGGILRWCDSEGAGAILERLARYEHLGKRFEPTETLKRHARTGEAFYPRPKLDAESGFGM